MSSNHTAIVFDGGNGLFVFVNPEEHIYPLTEVYNPDTLGALNNPEEFVLPKAGDDITDVFDNYLKLKSSL